MQTIGNYPSFFFSGEKGDCDKNDFKGSQGCLCGESQSLYQFNSVHSGGKKEDREWTLGCQYIPGYSEAKPFKNDDYVETSYGGIYQTQFHNLGKFLLKKPQRNIAILSQMVPHFSCYRVASLG